jgi:hypothetical protein
MCCPLAIAFVLGPRIGFFLWWWLGASVERAMDMPWPFFGLIFAPWTAIAYTAAFAPVEGVTGIGWGVVALGVLGDLGSYGLGPLRAKWE